MRILVAPDKFKGVQSAREIAAHMAAGLEDELPDATIEIAPIADGGEGTAEVMCAALAGEWRTGQAHDPIGRAIFARYVWLYETTTVVMEMSEAAGLHRLQPNERDVEWANTFGVGQMILEAARQGASEIIVGLGGSATNDGGFGMARALGFRFLDSQGQELSGRVTDLIYLARILPPRDVEVLVASTYSSTSRHMQSPLQRVRVVAAADVRNPLLKKNGATAVFARQKGATDEQMEMLENAMARLAEVVTNDLGVDHRKEAGAGAAGGLGFGLASFCRASLRSGFEVVASAIDLKSKVKWADIVVTGEGSLDEQTLEGKAPGELARMARKAGKPVYAIVGRTENGLDVRDLFDGIYAVARPELSDEENIANATELLREGARQLGRTLKQPLPG